MRVERFSRDGYHELALHLAPGRLCLRAYRGEASYYGPQSDPWNCIGWGRFSVGGAGLWVDFWPMELVLSVEVRPPEVA